jgi:hypothetical protein
VRDLQENATASFVVLDACRDNPFVEKLAGSAGTRSASASRGLARIKAAGNGTVIAYAAAAGEVASDGTGEHSPYTKAFLAHVAEPNVEVGLVFRRVAGEVVEKTGGTQRPEVLISLTREYYFAPQATAQAPEQVQAAAKTSDAPAAPVAPSSIVAPAGPSASEPIAKSSRTLVPYAALLARLDLSEPAFVPPDSWRPPDRDERAEAEPNQSPAGANPILVNSAVKLTVDPVGDADWFYFTSGAAGVLHIASPSPKDLDLTIRLLDAERRVVSDWKAAPRPGGDLVADLDLPSPGAFWLEVRDAANDAASQETAMLTLSLTPQEDGYEPNNAPSTARLMPANGRSRLNVFPTGDVDMLRFALDRPGELAVRAYEVPPELDIAMQLLDADHASVGGWALAPRPGGETWASFSIKKPGMYILEIRDGANDQRSAEAFTLESTFTPSPDAFEPNDTLATTTELSSDGEWPMTMFPRGDVDHARLEIEQPGELRLSAVNVPKNLDIAFRVLNADQRDLTGWIVAPRPGGDTVGSVDLPAGSYFIEIRDANNDQSSVEPFTMKAQLVRSPDNYEPNDSSALATPISPGGSLQFAILPLSDADWFKLRVDRPGELAISIDEGPANLDVVVRVVDSDGRDLTGWVPPFSKGGRTEAVADIRVAGTYFLEIRDGGNDGRSIEPATLTTLFTPVAGSARPHDSFGTAAEVAPSGSEQGSILPIGSATWQVLYAPGPGELSVTVDQVPEALDVVFHVLDGDQRDLTGWVVPPRKGGDTVGKVRLERAGWYWIEFRDGGNDARSVQPFRVTRQLVPG